MAERSTEIDSRLEFPVLMNWRRLYGHVAEIGVDRGTFSHHLLSCWYGASFFGVDDYRGTFEFTEAGREGDFQMACIRYEQFGDRARLLRLPSLEAAERLMAVPWIENFDFVYVDAGHEYADVIADLTAWWPLISPQGIIAGHDYDHTHPGVVEAVDEFFAGHPVYLTHEEKCPSWYAYKSGIPGPSWRRHP